MIMNKLLLLFLMDICRCFFILYFDGNIVILKCDEFSDKNEWIGNTSKLNKIEK